MKLNLGKVSFEGQVFEYQGAKLTIRPYPRSKSKFAMKDGAILFQGAEQIDIFKHCLKAWEGVEDESGNPIPLTESVKQTVFDSGMAGISDFVITKNYEMLAQMAEAEKN